MQRRPMSSVPGGSGENIVYALLCGGAFVGAVSYVGDRLSSSSHWRVRNVKYFRKPHGHTCFSLQAYGTVTSDGARFNERIAEIKARPKTEWTPKPWPPKSKCSLATVVVTVTEPWIRLSSLVFIEMILMAQTYWVYWFQAFLSTCLASIIMWMLRS